MRREPVGSSSSRGTERLDPRVCRAKPAIDWDSELHDLLEIANRAIGRLDGATLIGPNPHLIREIHGIVVKGSRGAEKTPGEFRRSQNWIGGSKPTDAFFVPPPAHELMPALDNLEKFLQDHTTRTPLLLKAALAHAQFEMAEVFPDQRD
jgi:Fic family protein